VGTLRFAHPTKLPRKPYTEEERPGMLERMRKMLAGFA
jgi:hypothetical protein